MHTAPDLLRGFLSGFFWVVELLVSAESSWKWIKNSLQDNFNFNQWPFNYNKFTTSLLNIHMGDFKMYSIQNNIHLLLCTSNWLGLAWLE